MNASIPAVISSFKLDDENPLQVEYHQTISFLASSAGYKEFVEGAWLKLSPVLSTPPTFGTRTRTVRLLALPSYLTFRRMMALVEQTPYVPADPWVFMTFGKKHPELSRAMPILGVSNTFTRTDLPSAGSFILCLRQKMVPSSASSRWKPKVDSSLKPVCEAVPVGGGFDSRHAVLVMRN